MQNYRKEYKGNRKEHKDIISIFLLPRRIKNFAIFAFKL